MGSGSPEPDKKPDKLNQVGKFLQKSYNKGELALKHAAGLGKVDNVVPETQPITNGPSRPVRVGWHPVGGLAGKWFAEQTGIGKLITEKINEYPDPTQHWAVLVGEYAHQLWMDENFDIIYTNARVDPDEWRTFDVGNTCFNDDAIRRTGEYVIESIRITRPGYNLISNNCQTYVLQLLDAIKVGQAKEFGTTLAVYEKLVGKGKVADLFQEEVGMQGQPNVSHGTASYTGQETGVVGGSGGGGHVPYHQPETLFHGEQNQQTVNEGQGSVSLAQQVMQANTTQLNTENQVQRHIEEEDASEKKKKKTSYSPSSMLKKLKF
ncbi:unnamed protein product [Periconia digitata]|uniref:Uncharacterized protein n=1 Tax=Periconia digitata TaxID=1303443 RepID=A0A9W4XH47_9PLEO|nr:unnamed protein product [Periconia digitata]